MLLTIDIGNTHILLGLYRNKKLISHWRISTRKNLTGDNYSVTLKSLFPFEKVKGTIICSVVPYLREQFKELFKKNLKLEPVIVRDELDLGITLDYENKKEIGADRIANAVGAYYLYKKGCIIVDLGTAITFDVVSPEGRYSGGAIAPGVEISSEALFVNADLLNPVSIEKLDFGIGKNTTESLQIGIIHGFASMIEGMTEKFKKKINFEPLIILTGGDAYNISKAVNFSHVVNPFLTLEGLRIIYERNSPTKSRNK
jgi:type III pantothenate kinase